MLVAVDLELWVLGPSILDIVWGDRIIRPEGFRRQEGGAIARKFSVRSLVGIAYVVGVAGLISFIAFGSPTGFIYWPDGFDAVAQSAILVGDCGTHIDKLRLNFKQGVLVGVSADVLRPVPLVDGKGFGPFQKRISENNNKLVLDSVLLSSKQGIVDKLVADLKKARSGGDPSETLAALYKSLNEIGSKLGLNTSDSSVVSDLDKEFRRLVSDSSAVNSSTQKTFDDWRLLLNLSPADVGDGNIRETTEATNKEIRRLDEEILALAEIPDKFNNLKSQIGNVYKDSLGRSPVDIDTMLVDLNAYFMPVVADKRFGIVGGRTTWCESKILEFKSFKNRLSELPPAPVAEYPAVEEATLNSLREKLSKIQAECEGKRKSLLNQINLLKDKLKG